MYPLERFRKEIIDSVAKTIRLDKKEIEKLLETPPENMKSDLALPCFLLAKKLKKDPKVISREIAEKIEPTSFLRGVESIGPYVNFYADWSILGNLLLKQIIKEKDKYGVLKERGSLLIDTFQPNPFKSVHIGHVRNGVIGESIRRILEFSGKNVKSVSYTGDVGTHVAKWIWYFKNFYKGKIPKKNFSKWAGDIYAKAARKVEEKPEYKEQVDELNRKIDARDKNIIKEWKKLKNICYDDIWRIQKELGIRLEAHYPESECEKIGKELVLKFLKQGKVKKSEGAIVINLEKYNLGIFLLLKSDGTALYSTKDMGLLQHKKKFKFDRLLYVVGSEQDLYFKQLFKAFDILGLMKEEKNVHISYGLVTLKEGKMASRLGNVIVYEDLKYETLKKVKEIMNDRKMSSKEKVAMDVALGAIKFSMLNMDNVKQIKFDWDQALDFQGKSGPYVQYTHARACSILEKERLKKFDTKNLKEKQEIQLLKKLLEFPESVHNAARDYRPLTMVNYVYEIATMFNEFYQSIPVLKADEETKQARLALVKSVQIALRNGLFLLGISAPIKM